MEFDLKKEPSIWDDQRLMPLILVVLLIFVSYFFPIVRIEEAKPTIQNTTIIHLLNTTNLDEKINIYNSRIENISSNLAIFNERLVSSNSAISDQGKSIQELKDSIGELNNIYLQYGSNFSELKLKLERLEMLDSIRENQIKYGFDNLTSNITYFREDMKNQTRYLNQSNQEAISGIKNDTAMIKTALNISG